jgi:oxygen-independent coproporphyrinogen-3 oxidase
MKLRSDYFCEQTKGSTTLYFGGGTPSIYSPEELNMLIQHVKIIFNIDSFTEVTLEANPDDLTPEYLSGLLSIGINRLSIGIQSFNDEHLRWMRRRHNAAQAIKSVRDAQSIGFKNITIDLIYGFPQLSKEEWGKTLDQALTLHVPHISAYHLTIEPHTLLGKQMEKGLLHPVPEEESEQQFFLLHKMLTQAGYEHYEVSNFALPGQQAIHNSAYWQQQPYIGIGPSAHSYNGESRQWNISNNIHYLEAIKENQPFYETELLTMDMQYNEYLLTGLRTAKGIDQEHIRKHFGKHYLDYFLETAKPYLLSGKLVKQGKEDTSIHIPAHYFFLSDAVIASLFKVTD